MITLAKTIATEAHAGQFRRGGFIPYIVHPERVAVALMTAGASPEAVATAWLHDVIEDTVITARDLLSRGVPAAVVEAVQILSRGSQDTYDEYLSKVRKNPLALKVKLADISDNLADTPTRGQVQKYAYARQRLTGVV